MASDAADTRDYLRGLLFSFAPLFRFDDASVEHLVQSADIADWDSDAPRIAVSRNTPQVHLLLRGVGVVEVRRGSSIASRLHDEPSGIKVLGPGEMFCVPPSPGHGAYTMSARSHPNSRSTIDARTATWSSDAMRELLVLLGPLGCCHLQEISWRFLWDVAAELAVLLPLDAVGRLRFVLLNLARRFPLPTVDGTLIDLELTDQFLASLVGTHARTVIRAIGELEAEGFLHRSSPIVTITAHGGTRHAAVAPS